MPRLSLSLLLLLITLPACQSPRKPDSSSIQYRDILTANITSPSQNHFQWWINDAIQVTADATDTLQSNNGSGWTADNTDKITTPAVFYINWTVNTGSFTDPHSLITTWIGPDSDLKESEPISLQVTATEQSPNVLNNDPVATTHPTDLPESTSLPLQLNRATTFDAELQSAASSSDRDEKIRHLCSALALRPNDPQNIVLEFSIGIELSQRCDPARKQFPKEQEALAIFEGIVRRYDHKAYYNKTPGDNSNSPDLMVPRAAILAASTLRTVFHQDGKAREYLIVAIKDLVWTCQKRKSDWAGEPRPTMKWPPISDSQGFVREIQHWQATTRAAAENNIEIAGPYGPALTEAVIREYRLTYQHQNSTDIAAAMTPILHLFKDTPLSGVAKEQIISARKQ